MILSVAIATMNTQSSGNAENSRPQLRIQNLVIHFSEFKTLFLNSKGVTLNYS